MRYGPRALAALVALLAGLGSVAAQQPGPDASALYAHVSNADGCCEDWMNPMQEDPDSTHGFSATLPDMAEDGSFTFTIPLQPALEDPLTLNGSGAIEFIAYIGGQDFSPSPGLPGVPLVGEVVVSTELRHGDDTVAAGEEKTIEFVNEYVETRWSVQPEKTLLDGEDGNLVWTITGRGTAPVVVIAENPDDGLSRLELPIGVESAGPVTDTLTGKAVDLSFSFTESTDRSYQYTWSRGPSAGSVAWEGTVETGSVSVSVRDAGGAVVFEGSGDDAPRTAEFSSAADGSWAIEVELMGFTGDLGLSITPAAQANQTETGTTTGTTTSDTLTNTTATGTSNESPGVALPVAVASVGLAVIAVRRRLR